MKWYQALKNIRPYIFKISTPNGFGTGFQIHFVQKNDISVIATAYHVISHSFEWEENIKLTHFESKGSTMLKVENRQIIPYPDKDLAFILFTNSNQSMNLPVENPQLIESGKHLIQGVEIGWGGFPVVSPDELCFFAGYVSACLEKEMIYLIDGVAINGVSGGPAFSLIGGDDSKPTITGVITAYIPNRDARETLPGVCVVVHLEPYQGMLSQIRSWDDAEKRADEQAEALKKTTQK